MRDVFIHTMWGGICLTLLSLIFDVGVFFTEFPNVVLTITRNFIVAIAVSFLVCLALRLLRAKWREKK